MKSLFWLAVILFAVAPAVSADVYIKHESHTEEYYYGGRVRPAEDDVFEVWVGDDRMSYISEHRKVIIDVGKNLLTFVNRDDSTYAETSLPLDWASIMPEETVAWLARYERHGTVTKTDEVKQIDGKDCRCYEVNSWINVEDSRYNETDEKIWVTTDLPIDWDVFGDIGADFRRLRNNAADFVAALSSIEGYPIAVESERYIKGFGVKTFDEVTEIAEEPPPVGVYSVPKGFEKKEKLSRGDLSR
jgi:hypothetical protein